MIDNNVQEQFAGYLQRDGLAATTIKFYLRDVKAFVAWQTHAVDRPVAEAHFTRADIEAYQTYLLTQKGQSPATINRIVQSLRKYGQFLLVSDDWTANPARAVPLARLPAALPPRVLTEVEVDALLAAARQGRARRAGRDEAILHLFLGTGIRAGEMAQLRLVDVDWSEGLLSVAGDTPRRLPLAAAEKVALRRYWEQAVLVDNGPLFRGRGGAPLSVRMIQQLVTDIGQAADLAVSVRVLRDTYARNLWQASGDLALLVRRLGYKNPSSALRHINYIQPDI